MKRIISILSIIALVSALFLVNVSAADGLSLIPEDGTWLKNDNGGASCNLEFVDGAAVFSGSFAGTWPDTTCYYDAEDYITADIDEYSLHYDFNVTGGFTNVSLLFANGSGSFSFPIANSTLGAVNYDAGSGDLGEGDYSGYVALSDFVNSTKLYDNSTFDQNCIVDNAITFCGIQVYSVSGGVITVNALEVIANDDIVEEESSEPEESTEESVEESAEESAQESATESDEPADESEKAPVDESAQESATESDEAPADDDSADTDSGNGWLIWVIIAVAAIAIVVVVIIILKKK